MEGTSGKDPPLLAYASGPRRAGAATSAADPAHPGETYRLGETLVATDGASLPPRCVLCAGDAFGPPLRLSFSWDTSFRITKASTLQMARKARLFARLCKSHRRRWSRGRAVGIIGAIASSALTIAGVLIAASSEASQIPLYATDGIDLVIAGFACTILFLFWFALRTRTLSCDRIEDGYLYLYGASAQFLATLPELPGRPSAPPGDAPAHPPAS